MTPAQRRGVVLAALFLIVASPLVMVWSWETDRVDQCTTRGGSFDFAAMTCDLERGEHPFVSFAQRHPRFVTVTLVVGLAVLGAGFVASTKDATNSAPTPWSTTGRAKRRTKR